VDIGGTFTDAVMMEESTGELRLVKMSSTPHDPSIGFMDVVERVLRESGTSPGNVNYSVHATTIATNTIIEGKGARAALIATDGFRDVFEIARQIRPSSGSGQRDHRDCECQHDSNVPTNDGFYRLIDVKAPEGTVVNAQRPAGVVGGWEVAMRLCDLAFRAFSDAMPQKVMASTKSINCHMACGGRDPRNGEYYTFIETIAGGYGGRPTKDGLDAVQAHMQNTENSAVEETENNLPFMITRYELVPDSEGAGHFRGGLGVRRDWMFRDHAATVTIFSDNRKFAPWGLFGGGSASPSRYILDPDGEAKELPSKITLNLAPDSVISYRTPGGGGYGPALERDPELVLGDVINGKVSVERARTAYGVSVDLENRRVDAGATAKLREMAQPRREER
jgi:N-methylhydantoinase B/oxoprolinase/acetone carboxylase alpha subunit